MILATLYFLVFCFIVSKLSFFKDEHLSLKFIFGIISIKLLGCFAYYWIYFHYYPGNFQSDSSSTMHDAKIIYDALPNHVSDYFKIVFGFHTNLETDPLYDLYFKNIDKWGRADVSTEYFLNDNRTSIRINALIMLFSFGKYAVHALVMLVISFIGQYAFYKTFKNYFPKKEVLLAIIIFLAPSVLFWTSGVLKEPIALFLLGLFIYSFFKLFVTFQFKLSHVIVFCVSILFFLVLKPYILVLIVVPLMLFALVKRFQIRRIAIFYISSLLLCLTVGIVGLKFIFHKDVLKTIVIRQNDFVNLSKGGIFFLNDKNYLRLEYTDSSQFICIDAANRIFKIRPHAKLMYWDLKHIKDTIYVNDNQDTSLYKLLWVNAPAGSAINMDRLEYSFSSFAKLIPQSFFNVLCKPFFYDSRSIMEHMASLENLCFLLFFVLCFWFRQKNRIDKNLVLLCFSLVITSFILVGITTTVMGAIVRYKVPFIPFLLMIPLMYLDHNILLKMPVINRFFKDRS